MADVNKLWSNMEMKLTLDEMEDIFNRMHSSYNFMPYYVPIKVKRVIFSPPATIILWTDNTKSVVKCQNEEPFDVEKGFVMAYLKKLLGNDNTFNKEINKWVKYEAPVEDEIDSYKPLTIEQLRKMNGKSVYVVSLNEYCLEDHIPEYSGWRTVDVESDRVVREDGAYYEISNESDKFGFHAYLKEKLDE